MSRRPLALLRALVLCLFSIAAVLATLPPASCRADDAARGFVDRVFKDDAGEHKYVLFVPDDYSAEKKWPVLLYLHGAFERGTDGRKQIEVGLGPYVKARSKTFPFLVVFPQAEERAGQTIKQTWSPASPDGRRALKILSAVEKEYNVDEKRRVLTGWSMGGYGVWQIAAADPKRFSALVPLSGGGDAATVKTLKDVPVWAFHGAEDRTVPLDETRALIAALKEAGGRPRYSELADVGHSVFEVAYASDELFRWMLNPTFSDGGEKPLRARPGVRPAPLADETEPFRPAVEVPQAIALRLGSDALKAISYSLPATVPPDVLSGGIGDIHDTTSASGRTFRVTFTRIRYDGKLSRAYLETTDQDRLRIWLGLEDLRLSIGTTYMQGSSRSAVAGPISIVIGHRRPVWLKMEVDPYVEERKLRFKLQSTGFQIPDGNWHVSPPAGVSANGLGMTRSRVSSGLVGGLYGSKGRIEQEVRAVVPTILERLEAELDLAKLGDVVDDFWPLPVFRPRVRLFVEDVRIHDAALSISLGITAAAIDSRRTGLTESGSKQPRRAAPVGATLDTLPDGGDLRVHLAAGLLGPLTELLISSDVARVHVDDIPGGAFSRFTDPAALAEAIPDFRQYPDGTQIWSELILAEPLQISDAADGPQNTTTAGLQFNVPSVLISTAIKTDPNDATWTPYAEFEFSVSQQAQVKLVAPGFRTRILQMGWTGAPQIRSSARFASGYRPKNSELDLEQITAMFAEGWRGWTSSGPIAKHEVRDFEIGNSTLRLSDVGWAAPDLFLAFRVPGIKITNSSEEPLVYETKGPDSGWGGPFTLQAAKSHQFDIPYPMLFRRRIDGEYRVFTLPVGSHSEFRRPQAGGAPRLFEAREEPVVAAPPEEAATDGSENAADRN